MPNESKPKTPGTAPTTASPVFNILKLVAIAQTLVYQVAQKGLRTEEVLASYRDAIAQAEHAAHELPTTAMLHVLTLNDSGTQVITFETAEDREQFLTKQDDCINDFYTLDVEPDGRIDFCLATVGADI